MKPQQTTKAAWAHVCVSNWDQRWLRNSVCWNPQTYSTILSRTPYVRELTKKKKKKHTDLCKSGIQVEPEAKCHLFHILRYDWSQYHAITDAGAPMEAPAWQGHSATWLCSTSTWQHGDIFCFGIQSRIFLFSLTYSDSLLYNDADFFWKTILHMNV